MFLKVVYNSDSERESQRSMLSMQWSTIRNKVQKNMVVIAVSLDIKNAFNSLYTSVVEFLQVSFGEGGDSRYICVIC